VNEEELWSIARGVAEPGPQPVGLAAGDASLVLFGGDVRYYKLGGRELLRRLYVAVRNEAWETLPAVHSPPQIHYQADGGVRATYEATVEDGAVRFSWSSEIVLGPFGDLTYSMTGTAGSSFDYGRIGLNILHPPTLEGAAYRAVTPDGVLEGAFPTGIGPQPYLDGEFYPLLVAFRSLQVTIAGPVVVHFDLRGDEFEIEDQRNWLDASYKIYSTPMSLGVLHAEKGQSFFQEVHVRAEPPPSLPVRTPGGAKRRVLVQIEESEPVGAFPAIGLGLAGDAGDLKTAEREMLAALRLGHLRVDVRLSSELAAEAVARADSVAAACGCGLELAVFLDTASGTELARLSLAVEAVVAPIGRVLVFSEHELVSSPALVAAARHALGAGVPVFGGTNLNFADLNRDRPDPASADGFGFSANPQVHAAEDRSLTETPPTFADMLATARSFLGARPVAVGPITLLARFNADAPGAGTLGTGEPPPADHRQASLVCAVFAAMSVKHLGSGGAVAATFFETCGDRGVLSRAEPDRSSATRLGAVEVPPGTAFPVYHVLSVCSRWAGRGVVPVRSGDPLSVDGAACQIEGRLQVLVANNTAEEQLVELRGPSRLAAAKGRLAVMDAASVSSCWLAAAGGSAFSALGEIDTARAEFELGPYAVALVELETN
jgi:D-apionolactonase